MDIQGYEIRLARLDDVQLLPPIEREANTRFFELLEDTGLSREQLERRSTSVADLQRAQQVGLLWVAVTTDNVLVGFALVLPLESCAHLEELAVAPQHGSTVTPSRIVPSRIARARRFSTSFWMTRLSGRAPYCGS